MKRKIDEENDPNDRPGQRARPSLFDSFLQRQRERPSSLLQRPQALGEFVDTDFDSSTDGRAGEGEVVDSDATEDEGAAPPLMAATPPTAGGAVPQAYGEPAPATLASNQAPADQQRALPTFHRRFPHTSIAMDAARQDQQDVPGMNGWVANEPGAALNAPIVEQIGPVSANDRSRWSTDASFAHATSPPQALASLAPAAPYPQGYRHDDQAQPYHQGYRHDGHAPPRQGYDSQPPSYPQGYRHDGHAPPYQGYDSQPPPYHQGYDGQAPSYPQGYRHGGQAPSYPQGYRHDDQAPSYHEGYQHNGQTPSYKQGYAPPYQQQYPPIGQAPPYQHGYGPSHQPQYPPIGQAGHPEQGYPYGGVAAPSCGQIALPAQGSAARDPQALKLYSPLGQGTAPANMSSAQVQPSSQEHPASAQGAAGPIPPTSAQGPVDPPQVAAATSTTPRINHVHHFALSGSQTLNFDMSQ